MFIILFTVVFLYIPLPVRLYNQSHPHWRFQSQRAVVLYALAANRAMEVALRTDVLSAQNNTMLLTFLVDTPAKTMKYLYSLSAVFQIS